MSAGRRVGATDGVDLRLELAQASGVTIDPASLPDELVPYADALELATVRPFYERGWSADPWPAPHVPLIPGAPPFDGVYRGSWISPGVCVRLDLAQVPAALRSALGARYPGQIGGDGAFYELGVALRSQRDNRTAALLELALKVATSS